MTITKPRTLLVMMIAAMAMNGCSQSEQTAATNDIWPMIKIGVKDDANMEQKIADLLGSMSLEQKISPDDPT